VWRKGSEAGGVKRKRHSRGEGVCARQQAMAVSGRASLPAPGAPGLWPHNEGLFEFTFKHHRVLGKTVPHGLLLLTRLGFPAFKPVLKGFFASHPDTHCHVEHGTALWW